MKCVYCGKEFYPGNRMDGIPNGVGLQYGDKIFDVCSDCIMYHSMEVADKIQKYDKDTATEIEFLERLYEKVGADMRGEQECTKKI